MSAQQTLAGGEADESRTAHGTQIYCWECNEWLIRTRRDEHPHPVVESVPDDGNGGGGGGGDGGDDGSDEPERAGALYEITLSFSVDYRFRVPAWNEHQAKERAEDLVVYPSNCLDAHQVHSRERELEIVMTDDPAVPDDYDPESGVPLHEVYGAEEDS